MSHMKPKKEINYQDIPPQESSVLRESPAVYRVERIRNGLSFHDFHFLRESLGITEERLGSLLGMSRATLHRRKKEGILDSAESDRLVRYNRLLSRAWSVLGSPENAKSWLQAPAVAFHGESPLDYADTETGAREVEALLGRLEYGVFS